jgi:hypothetical protein
MWVCNMKQLFLIIAFFCSTFAAANDSIVTNSVNSNDSTAVKANQQTINNGNSAKYVEPNSIDSAQKAFDKQERRKAILVAGIGVSVAGTLLIVIITLYMMLLNSVHGL